MASVIAYHDEENSRYVIHALNTMPGYDATANDVNIYLQTKKKIVSAYNITAKNSVPFEEKDGCVRISLSRIDGFAMTELKYGENEK